MTEKEKTEGFINDNGPEGGEAKYLKEGSLYTDDLLKNGSMQDVLDRFEDLYTKKGKYRELLLKEKEKIMMSGKHGDVDDFVKKLACTLLYFAVTKSKRGIELNPTVAKLLQDPDSWAQVLLSPTNYKIYLESQKVRQTDSAMSGQYHNYNMLCELMKDQQHSNLYGDKMVDDMQQALSNSSLSSN